MTLSGLSATIVEPIPVLDTFVTGIMVEDCGDHFRVVGYTDRHVHGGTERTICSRVVMTKVDFANAIAVGMEALGVRKH